MGLFHFYNCTKAGLFPQSSLRGSNIVTHIFIHFHFLFSTVLFSDIYYETRVISVNPHYKTKPLRKTKKWIAEMVDFIKTRSKLLIIFRHQLFSVALPRVWKNGFCTDLVRFSLRIYFAKCVSCFYVCFTAGAVRGQLRAAGIR